MKTIIFPFNQNFLQEITDIILNNYSNNNHCDLSGLAIILSGKRSQRRLLEILSEKSAKKNALLSPPIFFTPKSFCKTFAEYFVNIPIASSIEQTIAWINAAEKCEDAIKSILVKNNKLSQSPERDFFRVAQLIMPLHKTLSGEGLSIKKISKNLLIDDLDEEKKRWLALAEVEKEYYNELQKNNLIDPYGAITIAIDAARQNSQMIFDNLLVINVVDSFNLFGKAVETQSENLTIFSLGKKEYFDKLGFLKVKNPKLENDFVRFQQNSIRFLNSPNEQAGEIIEIIKQYANDFGYGDFVIAAPDSQTYRPIVQALKSVGINCHNAAGIPFKETETGCLLNSLANCLDKNGCETESFIELINHPLIENLIIKSFDINSIENYNNLSSEIFNIICKHKIEIINKNTLHFFKNEKYPLVKQIPEFIFQNIISSLSAKANIIDWLNKINLILKNIFSTQFDLPDDVNCSAHDEALEKWVQLCDEIINSKVQWKEICDAKTTILRCLSLLKNTNLIPKPVEPVIDMTGWLEIALADSPITIITGFNEGMVPEKFSADPFLPNTLREKLNLPNYTRRFLRDKYLTKCITEKNSKCFFLTGRRSSENNPLKPGKILFCQEFEKQAKILKEFYAPAEASKENGEQTAQSTNYVDDNQQILSTNVQQHITLLKLPENFKLNTDFLSTLSVSSINDYISCPFKFFLKKVRKIYAPKKFSNELEGLDIGNILHTIINKNLNLIHSDKNNEQVINAFLDELKNIIVSLYGNPLNPIIQIQQENLKRRIRKFVTVFRDNFIGWEVMEDEKGEKIAEYEIIPELEINNEKIKIQGYVDLIEKNGNKYSVIDFKTGNKNKNDSNIFSTKKQQWKDVQLILYAYWLFKRIGKWPEMAFFNIPPKENEIKYKIINIDDEKKEEAISFVQNLLKEIIDDKISLEIKFRKTENMNNCKYCDYKQICNR
ncbi:MAG: hypothetical protein DRI44_00625 [Chlamydiae bacterium]|nr:MAG: hypothetical protein DRI44_00625 [Chlamydiota bacterium]